MVGLYMFLHCINLDYPCTPVTEYDNMVNNVMFGPSALTPDQSLCLQYNLWSCSSGTTYSKYFRPFLKHLESVTPKFIN